MAEEISSIGVKLSLDATNFMSGMTAATEKTDAFVASTKQATTAAGSSGGGKSTSRSSAAQNVAVGVDLTVSKAQLTSLRQQIIAGLGAIPITVTAQMAKTAQAEAKGVVAAQVTPVVGTRSGAAHAVETNVKQHLPKRAMGGPVYPGTSYLVGERGPEVFQPARAGYVHANRSGGGPIRAAGGMSHAQRAAMEQEIFARSYDTFSRAIDWKSQADPKSFQRSVRWYQRQLPHLQRISRAVGLPVDVAANIVAEISSNNPWPNNAIDLMRLFPDSWRRDPTKKLSGPLATGRNRDRIWDILQGHPSLGVKKNPFSRALMGDPTGVPADVWMARLSRLTLGAGSTDEALSAAILALHGGGRKGGPGWRGGIMAAETRQIQAAVNRIAMERGLEPRGVQAALWDIIRDRSAELGYSKKAPLRRAIGGPAFYAAPRGAALRDPYRPQAHILRAIDEIRGKGWEHHLSVDTGIQLPIVDWRATQDAEFPEMTEEGIRSYIESRFGTGKDLESFRRDKMDELKRELAGKRLSAVSRFEAGPATERPSRGIDILRSIDIGDELSVSPRGRSAIGIHNHPGEGDWTRPSAQDIRGFLRTEQESWVVTPRGTAILRKLQDQPDLSVDLGEVVKRGLKRRGLDPYNIGEQAETNLGLWDSIWGGLAKRVGFEYMRFPRDLTQLPPGVIPKGRLPFDVPGHQLGFGMADGGWVDKFFHAAMPVTGPIKEAFATAAGWAKDPFMAFMSWQGQQAQGQKSGGYVGHAPMLGGSFQDAAQLHPSRRRYMDSATGPGVPNFQKMWWAWSREDLSRVGRMMSLGRYAPTIKPHAEGGLVYPDRTLEQAFSAAREKRDYGAMERARRALDPMAQQALDYENQRRRARGAVPLTMEDVNFDPDNVIFHASEPESMARYRYGTRKGGLRSTKKDQLQVDLRPWESVLDEGGSWRWLGEGDPQKVIDFQTKRAIAARKQAAKAKDPDAAAWWERMAAEADYQVRQSTALQQRIAKGDLGWKGSAGPPSQKDILPGLEAAERNLQHYLDLNDPKGLAGHIREYERELKVMNALWAQAGGAPRPPVVATGPSRTGPGSLLRLLRRHTPEQAAPGEMFRAEVEKTAAQHKPAKRVKGLLAGDTAPQTEEERLASIARSKYEIANLRQKLALPGIGDGERGLMEERLADVVRRLTASLDISRGHLASLRTYGPGREESIAKFEANIRLLEDALGQPSSVPHVKSPEQIEHERITELGLARRAEREAALRAQQETVVPRGTGAGFPPSTIEIGYKKAKVAEEARLLERARKAGILLRRARGGQAGEGLYIVNEEGPEAFLTTSDAARLGRIRPDIMAQIPRAADGARTGMIQKPAWSLFAPQKDGVIIPAKYAQEALESLRRQGGGWVGGSTGPIITPGGFTPTGPIVPTAGARFEMDQASRAMTRFAEAVDAATGVTVKQIDAGEQFLQLYPGAYGPFPAPAIPRGPGTIPPVNVQPPGVGAFYGTMPGQGGMFGDWHRQAAATAVKAAGLTPYGEGAPAPAGAGAPMEAGAIAASARTPRGPVAAVGQALAGRGPAMAAGAAAVAATAAKQATEKLGASETIQKDAFEALKDEWIGVGHGLEVRGEESAKEIAALLAGGAKKKDLLATLPNMVRKAEGDGLDMSSGRSIDESRLLRVGQVSARMARINAGGLTDVEERMQELRARTAGAAAFETARTPRGAAAVLGQLLGGGGLEFKRRQQELMSASQQWQSKARQVITLEDEVASRREAIRLGEAENKPPEEMAALSKELTDRENALSNARKESAERLKRLDAAEKAVQPTTANVVRSFGAIILATSAYGAAFSAANMIIEKGLIPSVGLLVDQLRGWQAIATQTTTAMGEATHQARGNFQAIMAQAGANAGLSRGMSDFVSAAVEATVSAKAGAKAQQETSNLYRTALRGGPPEGLYGGYGGLFGTSLFGEQLGGGKGFTEIIANDLLKGKGGMEIPFLGNTDNFGSQIDTALTFLTSRPFRDATVGRAQGMGIDTGPAGAIADVLNDPGRALRNLVADLDKTGDIPFAPGDFSELFLGPPPGPEKEMEPFHRPPGAFRAPVLDNLLDKGASLPVYFDDLSKAAKRGAEAVGESTTGHYRLAKSQTELNKAWMTAWRAEDKHGMSMAEQGIVLADATDTVVESTDKYQQYIEDMARGKNIVPPEVWAKQNLRQLQAQQQVNVAQTERQLNIEIPYEQMKQLLVSPILKPGASFFAAGMSKESLSGPTGARSALAGIPKLNTELEALATQGLAEARSEIMKFNPEDLPKFDEAYGMAQAASASIARFTNEMLRLNRAASQASWANQIRLANRALGDALGLLGRVGSSRMGQLQREEQMISRASTQLSLALQQRQITTQVALAGFQAPGETGEERYMRQAERLAEADIAQQQLDLSKQSFSVSIQIWTENARRAATDARRAIEVMSAARTAEGYAIAAQERIGKEQQKLGIAIGRMDNYFAKARNAWGNALNAAASGVSEFGGAVDVAIKEIYTLLGWRRNSRGEWYDPNRNKSTGYMGMHAPGYLGAFARGATFTVGEAGPETVAILRNPRTHMLQGEGGGSSGPSNVTVNINGPVVRGDDDITRLARAVAVEVERSLSKKGQLLGLRQPAY